MVAIRDGKYAHSPLPDPSMGARHVDVEVMYNAERYRPRYRVCWVIRCCWAVVVITEG